jgi:HK97 family phage portal protein
MAVLDNLGNWIRQKLNPAQEAISRGQGSQIGSTAVYTHVQAYDKLDSVNRSVNMLVAACSSLDYDVLDKVHDGVRQGIRLKQLTTLLNFRPNPYQSAYDFKQNIFTDLVLDGNAFIYFDGTFMYHLPAQNVEILTDTKTYISGYRYNGTVTFTADEVFYFKDPSNTSIYRGTSRLKAAAKSMALVQKMQEFQENFFDNGAVFGTVLVTDNTLGTSAKERTVNYWMQKYSTKSGGRKPVILDSGLKPVQLSEQNFKDMDFDVSLKTHNEKIMITVGVPPVLLSGGNNANITPNLKLFYLETVLPIVRAYTSALERYFGYDIDVITHSVSALQPELKDVAAYHTTLVNGGVISPNEARVELRYAKISGHDGLRIPANIAGSAANPGQGGAPKKEDTP